MGLKCTNDPCVRIWGQLLHTHAERFRARVDFVNCGTTPKKDGSFLACAHKHMTAVAAVKCGWRIARKARLAL